MTYNLKCIGIVRSELKSLDECPKLETENAPVAIVEIFSEYIEGTRNIGAGSELLLITWLHLADRTVLTCHPRDDSSKPLTGVFSTRSADRPNPIGFHRVKVLAIDEKGTMKINQLEVLNNTPVIDIKPVL